MFFAGNIPNIRTPATDLPVISDRLSHNPPTASSSSRSASTIILDNDEYYRELINGKTTRKQLRRTYPGFDWN